MFLPTAEDTDRLGAALACALDQNRSAIVRSGFNIRLEGNLGAGKTSLTRATLRSLGVTGRIKSPTFTLLETYPLDGGLEVFHFDFYRFESPEEFLDAGFRDNFAPGHITFVEWSEKAAPYLPQADLEISLRVQNLSREATLKAFTPLGRTILAEVCA